MVRAVLGCLRVPDLGFGEMAGPEKEFLPMKSSWAPTVGHVPREHR